MALSDKDKADAKRNRIFALAAGATVCCIAILVLSQLGLSSSGTMAPVISLPMRVLSINAVAAILSVCAFEAFVNVDKITSGGKFELALPLLAPLAIFGFELLRSRDWSADRKADQFASFRASVLVSAALASAASLPHGDGGVEEVQDSVVQVARAFAHRLHTRHIANVLHLGCL